MIAIVDYGMGNVGSIANMLSRLRAEWVITSDHEIIKSADKLILPGVGAFDHAMERLDVQGLIPVIEHVVLDLRRPILGICLGVQIFTKCSEEGKLSGLGWIDAETIQFQFPPGTNDLKIPHMGWNNIDVKRNHPLFSGFDEPPRFYFVHSYHVCCQNQEDILATSDHGIQFVAAVCHGNIMGTQFHPEKSHKFGLRLLSNFVEMI